MRIHNRWILAAVLVAGVLGYLLGAKDDHPDATVRSDPSSSPSGLTTKAPDKPWRAGERSRIAQQGSNVQYERDAYGRGGDFTYSQPMRDNRFRPDYERSDATNRNAPAGSFYRRNQTGYLNQSSGYESPSSTRRYRGKQSGNRDPRFRPLENNEQTRRWRGNYQRMSISPTQLATPLTPGTQVTQVDPRWPN